MANPNTAYARIHLLPAKEAPYVVVIRRKPSKKVHIMRWNTQADEIEHGSWFTGRIYEMRSDVSFDGQWMVYFAQGSSGIKWTGICKPPYLKTMVHWERYGTRAGGGFFKEENSLLVSAGEERYQMFEALLDEHEPLPFSVAEIEQIFGSDQFNTFLQRSIRDGYVEDDSLPAPDLTAFNRKLKGPFKQWTSKPTPQHPILRMTDGGANRVWGRLFYYDLPQFPNLLGNDVTCAAYDSLGQLIVARSGRIEIYTLEDISKGSPSYVRDFEDLNEFEIKSMRPPLVLQTSPKTVRQISISAIPLENHPVKSIVVPLSKSAISHRIYELAGPDLMAELTDHRGTEPFATSAYYLRHYEIVHMAEPAPKDGIDTLRQISRQVFELSASRSSHSVALYPIGLASGWDWETCLQVTIDAARRFVAEDPCRWVRIVIDDESQAKRAQEILDD